MAYEPGEYVGLFASEYQALHALGNEAINAFLESSFTPVNGGAYYIFNGDELLFFDMLEGYGIAPGTYGTFFVYLKSTWNVASGI